LPGYLFGFVGAFLLVFMTPFSAMSGYHVMAFVFGITGIAWLGAAWRLKICGTDLFSVIVINLLLTLFLSGLTSWGAGYYPVQYQSSVDGVKTIEDAVKVCKDSGLSGWDLVAYAQNLTARKFTYSRRNPWDTPARAFERGEGYCQQQALALKEIYDRLGIDCRPVYAARCRFAAQMIDGQMAKERVTGHAWLKVKIDGKELDVCPGSLTNMPGVVNFTVLSEVKTLSPVMQPITHIISVVANTLRAPAK
jgi:hypothetical protein